MTRTQPYARFQISDACLYRGTRYMIVSIIWVDPHPGHFTWRIERLLDSSDVIEVPRCLTLEWITEHGIIETREGQRYQTRNVSENELEDEDDNPTWRDIDELRARHVSLEAQIKGLQAALKLKYRRIGINRRIGDVT